MTEQAQVNAETQAPMIGALPGAEQTTPQVPVAGQSATVQQTIDDPLYTQYHRLASERGETGSINGQYREVIVNGKPLIMRHPGIKSAMKTISLAFNIDAPVMFNSEYVNALVKSTVVYPDTIAKQGIDYFDEHADEFEAVVGEADDFLSKYLNKDN